MTKITELDRVADPVGAASTPAHLNEVVRPERVEPVDRFPIGWRVEDRGALPGR